MELKGQFLKMRQLEFNIKKNTPIMYANKLTAEEKLNRKKKILFVKNVNGSGYKGRVGAYELFYLIEKYKMLLQKV